MICNFGLKGRPLQHQDGQRLHAALPTLLPVSYMMKDKETLKSARKPSAHIER